MTASSIDLPKSEDDLGRRFDYIHGIFLTHYASFIATLLASFAWLAILWTQVLPTNPFARPAMAVGILFINGLALYFLSGIHLYSRLLTSRFVPNVVDEEIEKMRDWERRGWSMKLAFALRRSTVARRPFSPGTEPYAVRSPPFVVFGSLVIAALTVVEAIALAV